MSARFGESGHQFVLSQLQNNSGGAIGKGRAVIPNAGTGVSAGVALAGADAVILGINSGADVAIGDAARVVTEGITEIYCADAVSRGDLLSTDSNGEFVAAATNTNVIALHDGGAGTFVSAYVRGGL